VDQTVLKSAESVLNRGRLILASPNFAIYHGPAFVLSGHEHRQAELYYALLADARTGALRTIVWAQDTERGNALMSQRLVELEPNLVYDCPLNVNAQRLLGTVPVSWSFAMENLPPGHGRPLTAELSRLLPLKTARPTDYRMMERALCQTPTEGWAKADLNSPGP
jgi:hypothetical protein